MSLFEYSSIKHDCTEKMTSELKRLSEICNRCLVELSYKSFNNLFNIFPNLFESNALSKYLLKFIAVRDSGNIHTSIKHLADSLYTRGAGTVFQNMICLFHFKNLDFTRECILFSFCALTRRRN